MKRRDFMKLSSLLSTGMLLKFNGVPLYAFDESSLLHKIAKNSLNDRVLVLIEMHGGNDGLNTVIPINQYGQYYNYRANIAIPENGLRKFITLDTNLPDNRQVGLHPDMTAAKAMYDEGNFAVIQNVSYENMNGSHFRSRDVWMMGGGYNDYYNSGWMGRYLDYTYPGYPDNYPSVQVPDPLAIEMGNGVSLAFHREQGIPAGLSITDPVGFFNLINSVGVDPPLNLPDTHAGDEIEYIMQIEKQANGYAERLKDVYEAGMNSNAVYPQLYPYIAPASAKNNPLSPQLKVIARLLSGGVGTKIFICRIGGFDTHANQVVNNNPTMGGHAALLYHISAAVKGFYQDLQNMGLSDRVLTMTFSEFGRRVASNASYGTDHGNAAPMMVFGTCINPGVYGVNPDLGNLVNGNIPLEFDYRQVFTSVVKDWFDAPDQALQEVHFESFVDTRIDYVRCKPLSTSELFQENVSMNCYPNPTQQQIYIDYRLREEAQVRIVLYDLQGRPLGEISNPPNTEGSHSVMFDFGQVISGTYLVRLLINDAVLTRKVILSKS